MQSLSPFIPIPHLPTPANTTQLLPPEAHSATPLTQPQIHTLWLHAISLHNPITLSFRPTITAHKYLLKHLLHSPSTPTHLTVPAPSTYHNHRPDNRNSPDSLTVQDLKSPAHSPHAFFLFLNLGILYAFTGEFFLATRHFRTALGVDDGAVPGNTAVGHYLLGVAFFELRQYPKAARAFHQCLILFRCKNIMEGKPELLAAAPWVSPLLGAEEEEKKAKMDKKKGEDGKKEEKEEVWTGFKHKMYQPTTASSSGNHAKRTWTQWDLERKNVDENLHAAITASGMRPPSLLEDDRSPNAPTVHGIPGGALFWPLEEGRMQDPAQPQAKRPSSKPRKPAPSALVVEAKNDEAIGLGLQVPSRQEPLTLTTDTKGLKWNEETQKWEDYLPPLPPLSRGVSRRQPQQLSELDTSALGKIDEGKVRGDDGETTPKAFRAARVQHREQTVPANTGVSASLSTYALRYEAEDPSRKENKGDQASKGKTYTPSSYTTSPPTTVGSSFLSYYGPTQPQESERHLSERAGQPSNLSSAEEKHRSAYLALSGLGDDEADYDEAEDPFPLTPQPLFGQNTTDTPVPKMGSSLSPIDEGTPHSPRRRTIIHYESPYSSTATPIPSPCTPLTEAGATFQTRHNVPATASTTRPFPPRVSSLTPIPQTPLSTISEAPSHSPGSAILDIYGSLTPPDTASTYATDVTALTPSPSYPLSSHTPKHPTRPAPTPPPTAKPPSTNLPRVFSASPLNQKAKKPTGPSKSLPRGLGIGIAGLAGPEPAIGLEEAMRVRARRDEEGRKKAEEEARERREVEEEYRAWMKRVEEKVEEVGGDEGEMLLPTVFEGMDAWRRNKKARKRRGKALKVGAAKGEKEEKGAKAEKVEKGAKGAKEEIGKAAKEVKEQKGETAKAGEARPAKEESEKKEHTEEPGKKVTILELPATKEVEDLVAEDMELFEDSEEDEAKGDRAKDAQEREWLRMAEAFREG